MMSKASKGNLRKIDEHGRVTIPIELKNKMGIKNGDVVDLIYENGRIIIVNPQKQDKKDEIIRKLEYLNGEYLSDKDVTGLIKMVNEL